MLYFGSWPILSGRSVYYSWYLVACTDRWALLHFKLADVNVKQYGLVFSANCNLSLYFHNRSHNLDLTYLDGCFNKLKGKHDLLGSWPTIWKIFLPLVSVHFLPLGLLSYWCFLNGISFFTDWLCLLTFYQEVNAYFSTWKLQFHLISQEHSRDTALCFYTQVEQHSYLKDAMYVSMKNFVSFFL